MVMTCVMRYAWKKRSEMSGLTVHSLYCDLRDTTELEVSSEGPSLGITVVEELYIL